MCIRDSPKRLANCDIPICSACQYGKATRRPWRQKTNKNLAEVEPSSRPGDCVSVDQSIAGTPGLIAQLAGFMTKERYRVATVFVDHYSNLGYTYYQKTSSVEETLKAKEAFERYAASRGVNIRHYHADNGVFAATRWVEDCYRKGQGITLSLIHI